MPVPFEQPPASGEARRRVPAHGPNRPQHGAETPLRDGPGALGSVHSDSETISGSDGRQPAADATTQPAKKRRRRRNPLRTGLEWLAVIGGALLVALLIKTFLVQAFWIPSPSMNPALHEGDRVLVNKLADGVGDINRGDIIVFERPNADGDNGPEHGIKDLIKRVIGLPGEQLEARDGAVYVDGQRLDEPYLEAGTATNDLHAFSVPQGHVFVLGDNRSNSQDSRSFGPVPQEDIVGRAFFRVYPLSDIGRL